MTKVPESSLSGRENGDPQFNPTSVINMATAQPSVFSQECIGVGIRQDLSFGKDDEFNGYMTKASTSPESSRSGRESGYPQFNSSRKADMECNENEIHCKELYCATTMAGECAGIRNHENLPYGGDGLRIDSRFEKESAISAAVDNEYSQNQHVCNTQADRRGCQLVQSIPEQDVTSSCQDLKCKILHRRAHSEPKKGSLNIHFTKVAMLPSIGILMGELFTDKYATDTQGSKSSEGLPNAVAMSEKAEVLFEMATCREGTILSDESTCDLEKENLIEENVTKVAMLPSVGILMSEMFTDKHATDTQGSKSSEGLPNAVAMSEKAEVLFKMATCREGTISSDESTGDSEKENLIEENVTKVAMLPSVGILMGEMFTDKYATDTQGSTSGEGLPNAVAMSEKAEVFFEMATCREGTISSDESTGDSEKENLIEENVTKVAMLPSVGILMGEMFTDKYATDTQGSTSGEGLPNAVAMSEKAEVFFEMATCREGTISSDESTGDSEKENLIEENVFTGALIETPQVHAGLKHQYTSLSSSVLTESQLSHCIPKEDKNLIETSQVHAGLKHKYTSVSSSVLTDENESQLSHYISEDDKNLSSCQQTPNGNRVQIYWEFSESLGNKLLPSAGILMTWPSTDVSRNLNERSKPPHKVACTSTLQKVPLYSKCHGLDIQNPMLNSKVCILESTGILMSGLSIRESLCEQQPFTIIPSEQAVGNSIVAQANFEVNEATTCNFAHTCWKKDTCEDNPGKVALTSTESLTPALPNAFHSFQHRAIESYSTNDCTPGHFLNTDVHNLRSECSAKLRRQQSDSQNYVSDVQKHLHLSMGEIVNSAGVLMINSSARASPEQLFPPSITYRLQQKKACQIPGNQTATEERILQSTGILMTTDIQSGRVEDENKIEEHLTGTCIYM